MRAFLLFAICTLTAQAQPSLQLDLGGGQQLELLRVEPGTFTQGSPSDEAGRAADETQRTVTLTKPFYLGKYPVTRGQFARFVQATGYRTEAERGNSGGFGWENGKLVQNKRYTWRDPGFPQTDEHPVVIVDFADANAFCGWLSRQAGKKIVLPTEAQWEWASRGGGQTNLSTEAWHAGNAPGGTQPVGLKAANALGFHDLLGNTWEWCADWYAPYPPGAVTDPVQINPNLSDKPRRVLRGGAFSRPASDARPAKRFRNDPGSRNADNGFRVAALESPSPSSPAAPSATPAAPPELERTAPPSLLQPDQPSSSPAHFPAVDESEEPSRSSSSGSGAGFWIVLGLGGLIVFVLIRKLRGGAAASPYRSQSAPPSSPPFQGTSIRVRPAQDGFWVTGAVAAGSLLVARWMGASTSHTRTFNYSPGPEGHFVFTGHQPSDISVALESEGASAFPLPEELPPFRSSFTEPQPRRSSSYPPAY